MTVELGGIRLNRVHQIVTLEQTDLVHHRVPGREGNILQDWGRVSVRLEINGIFYGGTASKQLDALRTIYKQRKPVDFVAEIVGQAYFTKIILERFEVCQIAGEPEQFSYKLAIAEYIPAQEKTPLAESTKPDAGVKTSAANFTTVATLPDALQIGALPLITNPVEPLKGAMNPIVEVTKNLNTVIKDLTDLFNL